jgi:hypothetical protein
LEKGCLEISTLLGMYKESLLALVQNIKVADTTAAQARKGKDIQGIPWNMLSITREEYRQTRLEQYKNYENIPHSGEGSGKVKVTILTFFMYI